MAASAEQRDNQPGRRAGSPRPGRRTVRALGLPAVVIAGVAVVLVATTAAVSQLGADTSAPRRWHLHSDRRAWFQLDGDTFHGNDSCNAIRGRIERGDDDVVDFGEGFASTRMASLGGRGSEREMKAALHGARVWDQTGPRLVLTDPESHATWQFDAES